MNYSLQATISNVSMPPIFFNEKIFFIDKSSGKLTSLLNETMDVAWASSERMLSVDKAQGYLVCYGLNVFNPNGQLEFSGGAPYSYADLECNGILMWKLVDNEKETVLYYLFDLTKKVFLIEDFELEGVPVLFSEDLVITRTKNIIESFGVNIDTKSVSTLWSFDVEQFGSYMESYLPHLPPTAKSREIGRIFFRNGKIIVTLSRAVIALDPKTGTLLWKIDLPSFNPLHIVFDGSLGYIGTRVYYAVIDVEKGLKLIDTNFPTNVQIENVKISFVTNGSGLVLYNRSLYLISSERGIVYLMRLNPADGTYESGMILKTRADAYAPIFDNDRIYILNQDRELLIYKEC